MAPIPKTPITSTASSSGCIGDDAGDNEPGDDYPNDWEMEPEAIDALTISHPYDCGFLHEDALEYISGYIIKKLHLKEYSSTENSFTWVDQVSKGFLNKPSPQFLSGVKVLETVFHNLNALNITHCKRIHQRLMEKSAEVELPENIKKLFFKCRIHFRLRNLNRRLKVKKAKQRILGYKNYLKICL